MTSDNSDEITIKDLRIEIRKWSNFILSKWIIIIVFGIAGGIVGLVYAWQKKTIYKAELSFVLQDDKSNGGFSGASGLASQFGIDLGGGTSGEFSGDNLLELMKSRAMITKALLTPTNINNKTVTLADYYIEFNDLRKAWKNDAQLKNIHFSADKKVNNMSLVQNSVMGGLYGNILTNNLTVDKKDKKLGIITITLSSIDEMFSKVFTEVLVKVVSDFYIQAKTEREVKNVNILKKQADSVRSILYNRLSSVAESTDANPNPNPSRQILHVSSQRKQIEVGVNQAILNELVKNLEVANMTLLRETPLMQIIDRPILPLNKQRLGKTKGLAIGFVIGSLMAVICFVFKKIFYLKQ